PDYVDARVERIDTAWEYEDWVPTAAGEALLRNNQPVLAYIAGAEPAFTSKDHNYFPGDMVEKQLVVINNSREKIGFTGSWELSLRALLEDGTHAMQHLETGKQARIPLR